MSPYDDAMLRPLQIKKSSLKINILETVLPQVVEKPSVRDVPQIQTRVVVENVDKPVRNHRIFSDASFSFVSVGFSLVEFLHVFEGNIGYTGQH